MSGNYVLGNGYFLSGIAASYGNANVAAFLGSNANVDLTVGTGNLTTQGNVTAGNITTGGTNGNISGAGNVIAGFFYGDISNTTGGYGNANVATYLGSNANINVSIGTGTFTTQGNILAGGITTSGTNGNISGANNVIANYFYGDISNTTGGYGNANVATYLGSNANVNLVIGTGGLTAQANITTGANVQGGYILGNGYYLSGLAATYGNANVAAFLPTYTGNLDSVGNIAVSNNVVIQGNLRVNGTTTTINSNTIVTGDNNIVIANGAQQPSDANGAGITVGPNGASYTDITWTSSGNVWTLNSNSVAVLTLSANNVSAVSYVQAANVIANSYLQVGATNIGQASITTSATGTQTIANVPTTVGQAVEFLVKGYDSDASYYQISTVHAINDGSTADYTQFGAVALSQAVGTLSVTLSGGGTVLQVTPTSANNMTWTTQYRVM